MKYDAKTIGETIKTERKQLTAIKPSGKKGVMTQSDLAAELGYSDKKVVGNWETGKVIPSLEDMLRMCDLFSCDLGYLLGEYPTKTRIAADIQEETGLSEAAINVLRSEKHKRDEEAIILDAIGVHDYFQLDRISLVDRFTCDCDDMLNAIDRLAKDDLALFEVIPFFDSIKACFKDIYGSYKYDYDRQKHFTEALDAMMDEFNSEKEEYYLSDSAAYGLYFALKDDIEHSSDSEHYFTIIRSINRIVDALLQNNASNPKPRTVTFPASPEMYSDFVQSEHHPDTTPSPYEEEDIARKE